MDGKTQNYGVDWSQRFGAKCPVCGVYTKEAYKHTSWRDGYKERYHRCPNPGCRANFKSIASDPVSKGVRPEGGELAFLRDYNGKRGGIAVQQYSLPLFIGQG